MVFFGKSIGVTTGSNIGGCFTAIGSTTANFGLLVESGNVGIGTITPIHELDVAGDVNITGSFKVNGTNISNGSAFPRVSTITGMATNGTEYNLFGGTVVMPSNGDVCDINLGIDNSGSYPACKFTIMKVNGNAGFIVTGTQPAGVISTDTKVCGNYAGPFGYNFYVTVSAAGVVKIKCDDNRFTYTCTSIAYK